jgi:hypothetical protein
MTDEKWLDLALREADEAYRRGDWPVAATSPNGRVPPVGLRALDGSDRGAT